MKIFEGQRVLVWVGAAPPKNLKLRRSNGLDNTSFFAFDDFQGLDFILVGFIDFLGLVKGVLLFQAGGKTQSSSSSTNTGQTDTIEMVEQY